MERKIIFYFDQDGVIDEFEVGVSLERTFLPGFFASRTPIPVTVEVIKMMKEAGYDVRILTATYENGHARKEKDAHMDELGLDVPRIFVPYGKRKEDYIPKSEIAVLVDDYSENLHSWVNGNKPGAAKKIGVKFYNGINGNHGTWASYSVSRKMSADEIFNTIIGIAEMEKRRKQDENSAA